MKRTIEVLKSMQQAIRNVLSAEDPIEIGFPVPVDAPSGIRERAFVLYSAANSESAPFAVVDVDATTVTDAKITFCAIEDFFGKQLDAVADRSLPKELTFDEYLAARADVLHYYELIRAFLWQSPNLVQHEQMQHYCEAFKKAVPKGLYSYYFALNPRFFEWLGLEIG